MSCKASGFLALWALMLLWAATARGETPTCQRIDAPSRARAQALFAREHIYDCCDEPLADCLRAERVCQLAYRLSEDVCRRLRRGESDQQISRALRRRAHSMMTLGKAAKFDLSKTPMAGDPHAPVVLVEYASAVCPFAGLVTPPLIREIVTGRLKGKVRLHFRPYSLHNGGHGTAANLALVAAYRLGAFWPFLELLYSRQGQFDPETQHVWARECGMDPGRFIETLDDELTRQTLSRSDRDGSRNGVKATPTFFINGRQYRGEHRLREIIDVLEEEHDRLAGRRYRHERATPTSKPSRP